MSTLPPPPPPPRRQPGQSVPGASSAPESAVPVPTAPTSAVPLPAVEPLPVSVPIGFDAAPVVEAVPTAAVPIPMAVPTPEPTPEPPPASELTPEPSIAPVRNVLDFSTVGLPAHIQRAAQALLQYIGDDECSEVLMNGPNEILRKVRGVRYHCAEVRFEDAPTYHRVINEVLLPLLDTEDRMDGHTVVLEGQLELDLQDGNPPMLARCHVIAPPGVALAKVTIAKKPRHDLTLDDLSANGTMSPAAAQFLTACVRARRTIVVAGPTGSGKTTTLQALTHAFDPNDRIVVIEETPELRLSNGDVVYLRSTLQRPGMDPSENFTLDFWAKQANRMRMTRVIVGETRGSEFADWLVAANSGAEGSATTVHANSPRRTLDKMLTLASKSDTAPSELQLRREIAATVDIIVQCGFTDNRHTVTAIEEISPTVSATTGQIQTHTLFTYNEAAGKMVAVGRPSDALVESLRAHGVAIRPEWFAH